MSKDYHCKCGGQLMIDAQIKSQLPLGMGFRNGEFVIDCIVRTGYRGMCLSCGKQQDVYTSKKYITKKPRDINNKIRRVKS